jgi:FKBP-type peptidyl-prolyl cis-trans isomerase
MKRLVLLSLTLTSLSGFPVLGQEDSQATPPSSGDAMREMLVGYYTGGEYRLHIVGVESPPFEKPLYVELVRNGFEPVPDRQQLWWFYERDGKTLVRVMQFPTRVEALFATNLADLAVGAWGAPQFYPQVRSDQYDAVGDLVATMEDGRLTLTSEHPFAIAFGDAIDSEVTLTFDSDSMAWSEIGRNAQGQVVWPAPDEVTPIEMSRQDTMPRATQLASGVVIVDLREGLPLDTEGMDVIQEGDSVAVEYSGWLATGILIDSSSLPGRNPFIGDVPAKGAPLGFTDAMLGMRGPNFALPDRPFSGTVRRAFIPPSRGYGPQGSPPLIPANASLIFNFEVQSIKPDILDGGQGQAQPPASQQGGG